MVRKPIALALSLCILSASLGGAETPAPPANPAAVADPNTGKTPMIEVSVDSLEISESNRNLLGIQWGQIGTVNRETGAISLSFNQLNFLEGGGAAFGPGILDFSKFSRVALAAQLQALEQNNQLRVLANPTLLTKSGFEATFNVGGEIPYPTPAPVGQAPGVEFKKYGVQLKILPELTPRGTILAQISLTVSSPDESRSITIGGTSVVGLSTRDSNSKVEVNDGETVVLSGIKQSRRTKVVTKVPFLGSIPILGWLFRSKDEKVEQISLVQFVTFRLIK